jgi:two-component system, NtrC family, response regulator AtoC
MLFAVDLFWRDWPKPCTWGLGSLPLPDDPMAAFTENANEMTFLAGVPIGSDDALDIVRAAVKALGNTIRDVGASSLPVLILGESGTGKRALALAIHRLSDRSDSVFIEAECEPRDGERRAGQLSAADLLGSTIVDRKVGSVVFHEVGSLDSPAQAQLRQFLVDHSATRQNANGCPKLMFTSHRNLEQEVRLGRFREDVYYEISKVCLRIPPLRHRKDEILPLAEHLLAKHAALMSRPKPVLSESTLKFLIEYHWPGNARELEDAARTIAAIGDDRVAVAALRSTQKTTRRQNGKAMGISLKEASRAASRAAERELILKVLSRTQWNRKRAAEELKISYKALLYKLKQIGMHEPESPVERESR